MKVCLPHFIIFRDFLAQALRTLLGSQGIEAMFLYGHRQIHSRKTALLPVYLFHKMLSNF